jgi:hypothetical protein
MGWYPCSDCCGCDCLEQADLPNISINGMTGGAWQQSTCCWTKTFTFNTQPTTSTTCLPVHHSSSYQTIIDGDIYIMHNNKAPLFSSQQSFPLPLEYCCDSGQTFIGTFNRRCSFKQEYRMKISFRPKKIVVRLSKQIVDCNGVQSCKFILSTSYVYEYGSLVIGGTVKGPVNGYAIEVDPNSQCWEQNTDPFLLPCVVDDDGEEEVEFDCTTPLPMITEFSFNRVKLYDQWPTGAVPINNQAVLPSGCEIELCNEEEFATQVCLSATGSGCPYNCNAPQVIEQTWRPRNECDGYQEQYVYSSCDPALVVQIVERNPDARLCPEMSRMALQSAASQPPECFLELLGDIFTCGTISNCNYLYNLDPPYPDSLDDPCLGPAGDPSRGCIIPKDPLPTGCPDNFINDPCGDPFFWHYYSHSFPDITNYSYTSTCNNTTQQFCINAPTWTIIFT